MVLYKVCYSPCFDDTIGVEVDGEDVDSGLSGELSAKLKIRKNSAGQAGKSR